MYLNKDAILQTLTKEHIITICRELGCPDYKTDNQDNLWFSTKLCHNGDSPYKLAYYHEPNDNVPDSKGRMFHCYTCGDSFSPIELVIRGNRNQGKTITWYKALLYIANIVGYADYQGETKSESSSTITDFEWIERLKAAQKKPKAIPILNEINENILEMFCYVPHEEWLNDNISREALSRYEIGYYGLTNQIIIPHRDKDNRLIGIRGRFLDEKDIEQFNGKYMPLMFENNFLSHSLGSNLYGINVTKERIQQTKKCLLLESEKSCMQNYSYFGDSSYAVSVCGSNITLTQCKLLIDVLGVEEVIIGFDKEYEKHDSFEAESYYHKLLKKVSPLVPYVKISLLMDRQNLLRRKDSPTDRGKDVLLQLLDDKIVITPEDLKVLHRS